jgi:DNA-binding transcriptional regulator LsrR (DeoR family)
MADVSGMRRAADDEWGLLAAASMYYHQTMTMDTIGRRLHVSRSTVSRMLKRARELGLVEIILRPSPTRSSSLSGEIEAAYGIETYVVAVSGVATEEERLTQVAAFTARLVMQWMDSDMIMGVAWGTTVAAVAKQLGRKATLGSTIVQLNGAANTRTSGARYAESLLSQFAICFDAEIQLFPVPAFFDFAETREAMWRERSIERVLELQHQADIALFSVGALSGDIPSHVYAAGYLEQEEMASLKREGAVGDVCTVFLREDGTYSDLSLNVRATGPTPAELQVIPRRLCAAAGDSKTGPIRAALRAGAVTHLIVDERTAKLLISDSDT